MTASTSTTEGPVPADPSAAAGSRRLPFVAELGIALLLMMLVRAFLLQSFYVPTGSMEPTVQPGDRVVVAKWVDGEDLERGDVIVFDGTDVFGGPEREPYQSPDLIGDALAGAASLLSIDLGEKDYLKRVVGLPGDRVTCCDDKGRLSVNGERVDEAYLPGGMPASDVPFDVRVPEGRLFVLGDNRPESADSRAHLGDPGGGMVPVEDVIGTVLWRYWPLDRLGTLPEATSISSIPREGSGP